MRRQRTTLFLTNIPAPYREGVHEHASKALDGDYHVVYAARREPNREWDIQERQYERTFLHERFVQFRGRYIHVNPDVLDVLNAFDPRVVITSGFNPTFLLAFAWCMKKRRHHVPFSDTTMRSEANLTPIHTAVRKLVYRYSSAFIGASAHTLDLFAHYGGSREALFRSHLCVDNERYSKAIKQSRLFDLAFSGRIDHGKLPMFFADVAEQLRSRRPLLRVLVMGDGPLRAELLQRLERAKVDVHYAGFASQAELPDLYTAAKLLLFPTRRDAWGIVANEACAAGTPVLTCANAGVANDLVVHGHTGFVLPLAANVWADHAAMLLDTPAKWQELSSNCVQHVSRYSFELAGQGIAEAAHYCLRLPSASKHRATA